jgi:hypothetical protein
MTNYATEIIALEAGLDYSPTFIRTDRRRGANETTSLGYQQIGVLAQYGNAKGPIFRLEFADLTSINSASHIKIWGISNDDTNAPLYPIVYLLSVRTIIDVYVKKFIFCDSAGNEIDETGNYSIIGYKRNTMPISY